MERDDKLRALLRELPPAPPPTAAELVELSASVAKAAEWAQQIKLPEFKLPPSLMAGVAGVRPASPLPGADYMPPTRYGELSAERSPLRVELVEPVGKTQPLPKNKGGAPVTAIPPEILIEVGAWLAAEGIPEPHAQANVGRKIQDLLAARDPPMYAGDSTLKRWAKRLVDAHRRAIHEGS